MRAARALGVRSQLLGAMVLVAVASVAVTALLVNIFQRQQEAKNPFFRVVELTDTIEDPAVWGKNFPFQYDAYRRTVVTCRSNRPEKRCSMHSRQPASKGSV